ncbi:tetratricopeptide repeat protein [Ulvibacter sp. MAR_2010_11]|uniref:tetratricopeptide repeat protein n=1 Tax=Ulvibacter sp. MAR_2010_11 TaxID=1250229 RepID=UPI000C2CAEA0|nr:tetratricopeptide repeat protein [Ulvibacter sp. MAR_2010_11]PKA83122.1 tetratricopeptide repeat protein [Ulvibacter sp. MAR_2010_11]
MRSFLSIVAFFLFTSIVVAQSELLAKNYFDQGEYEKALVIFNKLLDQNPGRSDYFLMVVQTHQQMEQFTEAENLLLEKVEGRRINPQYYVELGYNYALQNNETQANVYYNKAIQFAEVNPNYAYAVGDVFMRYSLLDQAVIIFEKAMETDSQKDFNLHLARIYGEQGNLEKMFEKYIDLMQSNVGYKGAAQQNFSLYITEDPTNEANSILRKILLQKSQQNQDILYNQMLSWLFVQQKEFKKAFTQEKAIYKRAAESDLGGIIDVGIIAIAEKDYENAKEILQFVVENSATPEAKLQGHQFLMKIALATAMPKDYPKIEQEFESLFNEFGRASRTYLLQIDYNHFLAFQSGKVEEAISNLKELIKENLTQYQEARVKMELADILVFDEKFNLALIYYSQIQKKIQSDVLAQEARFKVARTSYFKGDFEWAQVQLDVLKKSASQLIANDAMQLSLMIRDNSLEDSTQTAIKKYAKADLMAFQNKNKEAIAALDEIITNHKGEKIEDEALLKQGELYEKTEQFTKAETNYLKLIEFYREDILADDAYYRLAKLYETQLQNPEKAKEYYEQIIFNFSDSIYFVEARKKYRTLRGDAIN